LASRAARLVLPVLCKLALVLGTVQVPGESLEEQVEIKKVGEECLLSESAAAPVRRTAQARRCISHLAGRAPLATAQRLAAHDLAHGHVLANGLRAPMLC
jgi:hypothetical protein